MTALSIPSSPTKLHSNYAVRIVTTMEEMEHLRPLWEALNSHPNAQVDFFRLINGVRDNVLRPHVMVLERDGDPCALVVGRMAKEDFRCRLGYKTIYLGQVQQLSIVYGGILGCEDEGCAGTVINELDRMLKNHEADLVFFNFLNTESYLFRLATQQPRILCRDHLVAPQLHWKTRLPATQAEFLKRLNKKHRYWLRRLDKQVEKDFLGQVSYHSFTDGEQLDELMKDLELVASKTYQRRLCAGFRNDTEYARRFVFEADKGWLRAYVLYIQQPALCVLGGNPFQGGVLFGFHRLRSRI